MIRSPHLIQRSEHVIEHIQQLLLLLQGPDLFLALVLHGMNVRSLLVNFVLEALDCESPSHVQLVTVEVVFHQVHPILLDILEQLLVRPQLILRHFELLCNGLSVGFNSVSDLVDSEVAYVLQKVLGLVELLLLLSDVLPPTLSLLLLNEHVGLYVG